MTLAARIMLVIVACWLSSAPAGALDPGRAIGQYKHTRWTVDDGAPASLSALAQGRDGYLWIGGRDGLFRFDGIRFEAIPPERRIGERTAVTALLVARDGSIWAGYGAGGIARYHNGVLRDAEMPRPDAYVISIVQAGDGAIWALLGRSTSPLVRFANGRWDEIGSNLGIPQEEVGEILAAKNGSIWLATQHDVLVLKKKSARFERVDASYAGRGSLSEDAAGRIWLSDMAGSRAIAGFRPGDDVRRIVSYPTQHAKRASRTFFDRDGNLWGVPGAGIYRVRAPEWSSGAPVPGASAIEPFRAKDGLTSDTIGSMIEDREGNIWVSTTFGLDRFRAANVAFQPRLTNRALFGDVLLAASDGVVYVGEADAVYRIAPGAVPTPLLQNTQDTEAICEAPDGAIWMVFHDRIVSYLAGKFTTSARPSMDEMWVNDCAIDRHDTLWLASGDAGMFRRSTSGWRQLMVPSAPRTGDANHIFADVHRTLYVGLRPNRIVVIDYPKRTDYVFGRPSRSTNIRTIYPTSAGLLLGGKAGLLRWQGMRVQQLSSRRFPELDNLTGIVQTPEGDTWTIGRLGIFRWSTPALNMSFANPQRPLRPTNFDNLDGFPGAYMSDGNRDVVRGGDGRLWFSTYNGTVMIDPARMARNLTIPPVAISALRTGGRLYRDPTGLTLRAGTSSLEIDFAVLSLSIPQRVRVRYRLEGADRGWIDPGMRRQAFYTNLGPGHYSFRVIAANDDGVWNRTGATLEFDVPPTFVQSRWFFALCLFAVLALLWWAYRLRLKQVRAKMRDTLEQRLAERERIARDLHDTLLQGFQGLIMQFQSIANAIPINQPARHLLEQALDTADDVLVEGRDSVQHLRAARAIDLAQAFTELADRLRRDHPVAFELLVEGTPQELHPVVREEICRIGDEALINAFRHAAANNIELAISYRSSQFSLAIRDDGLGIAQGVIDGGREGHFGLVGMRERAAQISEDFTITSRPGAGTEISVTVPARVAFVQNSVGAWRRLSDRLGISAT